MLIFSRGVNEMNDYHENFFENKLNQNFCKNLLKNAYLITNSRFELSCAFSNVPFHITPAIS